MGDPRRLRSKYSGPRHPWQSARIEEEKALVSEFGLKNKKEIWKASSLLKGFANQAKKLTATSGEQTDKETKQLLDSLARYGILPAGGRLDDVLSLTVKAVLGRRLQTIVFKKGLARTTKQARQFIIHEHITIGNKAIAVPSYLVLAGEEAHITFVSQSNLSNEEHPERATQVVTPVKEAEEKEEKKVEKKPKAKVKAKAKPKAEVKKEAPAKEAPSEEKKVEEKVEEKTEEKTEEKVEEKAEAPEAKA